jgi:hypothetical protein
MVPEVARATAQQLATGTEGSESYPTYKGIVSEYIVFVGKSREVLSLEFLKIIIL